MESRQKSFEIPWQAIIALAATLGVFLYFKPLETSRPPERSGTALTSQGIQDVEARLWQDPLLAVYAHAAADSAAQFNKCKNENLHFLGTLTHDMREQEFCILAVMIPGGAYAEYNEIRLRARHAVLEGLGTSGFAPEDGEHIGYVHLKLNDIDNEIVPFEWCEWRSNLRSSGSHPSRVLVLWLRDEAFRSRPLLSLNNLINTLTVGLERRPLIRLIGPRTSATLLAMLKEAASQLSAFPELDGLRVFSATSTASDRALFSTLSESQKALVSSLGVSSAKQLLERRIRGLVFDRFITPDDRVCAALIRELERRKIRLRTRAGHAGEKLDYVALVSEEDTFYGRALPQTFIDKLSPKAKPSPTPPENILLSQYLRGIDGQVPEAAEKSPETKTKRETSVPSEATEGLNQADYLRRLARQLKDKDQELRKKGKRGIKAIGVLGTDIYDKLLVLKSLHEMFPGAIYFTTNLDARFGHPDEWDAAHNLIVGSPFGLTLNKDFQEKIPPFRDAYQTAIYVATLAVFDPRFDSKQLVFPGPARIFEIGRNGPFDLTPDAPDRHHGESSRREQVQPSNPNLHGWLTLKRGVLICLLILCGILTLAWVGGVIGRTAARTNKLSDDPSSWDQMLSSPWLFLVVAFFFSWGLVYFLAFLQRAEGEPFAWMDGISIWPTEILRLLVLLMAGYFVWKTNSALEKNEDTIERDFGFPKESANDQELSWREWFNEGFSRQRFEQIWSSIRVRRWDVIGQHDEVIASSLWQRYLQAGEFMVRVFRFSPIMLLYLSAGLCILFLFGFPPVPARGTLSFRLDWWFLGLSVFGSVFVTFYIADATMLNGRLIHYLVKPKTIWDPLAYSELRTRWSSSASKIQPAAVIEPVMQGAAGMKVYHGAIFRWLRDWCDAKLRKRRFSASEIQRSAEKEDTPYLSAEEHPPETLLTEYLDIDLIAKRTEVVGNLIYYPFILITLLIVSRVALFDNWTWPVPLLIIIAGNGGYAAWSAFRLRASAEEARKMALQRLNDSLIERTAADQSMGADALTAREMIAMIKAEQRGAFAPISQHPIFRALLLPSGGAGLWALTQYLPRVF